MYSNRDAFDSILVALVANTEAGYVVGGGTKSEMRCCFLNSPSDGCKST
jgi:hypothetical protein